MTGRADIRRYSGGVRLEFSLLAKTDVVDCWSKVQRLLATWLFLLLADGSQTLQICWIFSILPLVCYFPLKDGLAQVHSRSDFTHLLDCKGVSLTLQHAATPDAPRGMKSPSNCANRQCPKAACEAWLAGVCFQTFSPFCLTHCCSAYSLGSAQYAMSDRFGSGARHGVTRAPLHQRCRPCPLQACYSTRPTRCQTTPQPSDLLQGMRPLIRPMRIEHFDCRLSYQLTVSWHILLRKTARYWQRAARRESFRPLLEPGAQGTHLHQPRAMLPRRAVALSLLVRRASPPPPKPMLSDPRAAGDQLSQLASSAPRFYYSSPATSTPARAASAPPVYSVEPPSRAVA